MKDIDLEGIGSDPLLEGYTGADLAALVKEASVLALTDYMKHKDKAMLFVTTEMVHQAASKIRPSVSPKVSYKQFFCCSVCKKRFLRSHE